MWNRLLALLSLAFRSHQFYFSHVHDVTRTLQSLGVAATDDPRTPSASLESSSACSSTSNASCDRTDGSLRTEILSGSTSSFACPGLGDDGRKNKGEKSQDGDSNGKGDGENSKKEAGGLPWSRERRFLGQCVGGAEERRLGSGMDGIMNDDATAPIENKGSTFSSTPDYRFFWNLGLLGPLVDLRDRLLALSDTGIRNSTAVDPNAGDRVDGAKSIGMSSSESTGTASPAQMRPSKEVLKSVAAVDRWLTPVMSGFLQVERECWVGEDSTRAFDLLLVSRRSRLRQGTRFTRRGIDAEGNVANFVETEQVR